MCSRQSLVAQKEPLPPVDSKARKAVEEAPAAEFRGAPPVAECGTPPAALLDKPFGGDSSGIGANYSMPRIAQEVMKEERLESTQWVL